MRLILFMGLSGIISLALGDNFSGENYLIGFSVPSNGIGRVLPSQTNSPSQLIDFPADYKSPDFRLEAATVPLFDGLSEMVYGAIRMPIDSNTEVTLLGGFLADENIPVRPQLNGTPQERLLNPDKRPGECSSCGSFSLKDYPIYLNIRRNFPFALPRFDFSSQLIPVNLILGVNFKYIKSEVEGLDGVEYVSQNINSDAGLGLEFLWDQNRKTKSHKRKFSFAVTGFELLQTYEINDIAEQKLSSRYHLMFYWEENLSTLNSRFRMGTNQKSEAGKYPGFGLEWDFLGILYLRAGINNEFISGGVSLSYKFVSINYSLVHHDLGINPYQISLEIKPFGF